MSTTRTSAFDPDCRACPRLAEFLDQTRCKYPDYHSRPVAPFGDHEAHLLIVGLAPGMHGANASGRPFTGDHAGILLYRTLHEFGFSSNGTSVSRDDGLELINCRITNAVKCLPPGNKPRLDEIKRCNEYLRVELDALPHGSVIIALGRIAHDAVVRGLRLRLAAFPFAHGNTHRLDDEKVLIDSYHCSRYNTQTGRLTAEMFRDIFRSAQRLFDANGN